MSEALIPEGYFVAHTPAADFEWGIGTDVWGDGFPTESDARAAAAEHWQSVQPEWCDRCGDQAVCPDCVGS